MPMDLKPSQTNKANQGRTFSPIEDYYQEKTIPAQEYKEQEEAFESDSKMTNVLHQWQAPEFEVYEKSNLWYGTAAVFIIAMVSYALITNSPLMAITFILLGFIGYVYLQKDPRIITFSITSDGIMADKEMYLFENINSFWVFYEPPHSKTLSLHTKAAMLPYVHIPLENEDPVAIRELLMPHIPEVKQEHSLVDTLEKVLRI
ncbi:MAG TPA: hypothetical protein VF817_01465 [Patescibacteria group bacterium]